MFQESIIKPAKNSTLAGVSISLFIAMIIGIIIGDPITNFPIFRGVVLAWLISTVWSSFKLYKIGSKE